MNQTARRSLTLVVSAALVAATAAAGCSSNKPPVAPDNAAPSASAASRPSPSAIAAEIASSPTASAIRIDPRILKACGIDESKAFFAFDSAKIRAEDAAPLDLVARCFATGPLAGQELKLVGHADPRGESEYNFVIGQSRADAVAGYVATRGLDRGKIKSTSRGEMDASGEDEAGWARDRRVDVLLGP